MILGYIIKIVPILAFILFYFVRLEVKLARIITDLEWIKETLRLLQ